MRVVLDGVFNHASRGFWPFHHVLENGTDSPYIDWFIIHGWPLRPYTSDALNPSNYEAWWSLPALPKLNTRNPGVRDLLLDVARHWIDFGIDGWRLDVPEEIDDDSFWRAFRRVVKDANPDAYLCGEIWGPAQRWLAGDQFDAVMNYLFADATLGFFGARCLRPGYRRGDLRLLPLDAPAFARRIDRMHGLYDWNVNHVQLNLIDSHDMARARWILSDETAALRLCVLFQMTMPGAPCIYYGDEIGLAAGDDPACREAFPWHDEQGWDHDLLAFYRQATALRHRHAVLRTGTFEPIYADGGVYAFRRRLGSEEAVVVFNRDAEPARVALPAEAGPPFGVAWPPGAEGSFHADTGTLAADVPGRAMQMLWRAGAR